MSQYNEIIPLLDLLNAAGRELMTRVQLDVPGMHVERYGSKENCYLVFHNPTGHAATLHAELETKALRSDYQHAKVLFGPQKKHAIAISNSAFILHLDSHQTVIVKLE